MSDQSLPLRSAASVDMFDDFGQRSLRGWFAVGQPSNEANNFLSPEVLFENVFSRVGTP